MEIYDSAGVDLAAIRTLSLSHSGHLAVYEGFIDLAIEAWEQAAEKLPRAAQQESAAASEARRGRGCGFMETSRNQAPSRKPLLPRGLRRRSQRGSREFFRSLLDLDAVIETKEEVGALLDLAAMPTLRATLNEVRRAKS